MKPLFTTLVFLFLLLMPSPSLAVCTIGELNLKTGFDCVDDIRDKSGIKKDAEPIDLILRILNIVLSLAAIIAVIMLIISGFRYITAGGDEGAAEKAKHGIMYAIIGLVVIGISVAVVNLVVRALQGKEPPKVIQLNGSYRIIT